MLPPARNSLPNRIGPPRARVRTVTALLLLAGAALASHAPAFHADFIRFDDTAYVATNPHVRDGLRLANVRWALTGYEQSNWHPVTWISHMIDVELFGLDPRGHHGVNLALHALNAAVLFLALRALTAQAAASFLVAALFAVHPANVESVAWIAQRKTLLSTLFALLAIAAYARWTRGGGRRSWAASLALLALSLASKPMFVTFPFVLLLLDYWPLRRPAFEASADGRVRLGALLRGVWRLLPEKLPYLALCAAVAIVTLDAQRDAMSSIEHYPFSQRLGNVALSYVKYVGTFFAPHRLAVFYPLYPERLTPLVVYGCLALLAAITILAVRLGETRRHLLVGWLWFLGTLVPVIGLVHVGMQSMADRYVYVPFWGLAIALAWTLREPLSRRRGARAAAAAAAGIVLAVLGVLANRQAREWENAIRLFESAIRNTEANWLAHGLLAERYYGLGELERSVAHSEEAVKYNRDLGTVRSTYGLALHDLGKPDLALEQFELATAQEPDEPTGYMNLGWLLAKRGEHAAALAALAIGADKLDRTTTPYVRKTIYANWAEVLAKTGELHLAREKFERALAVEPRDPTLLRDAARVDLRLDDPPRARERLAAAREVDPADAESAVLLAAASILSGAPGETQLREARALGSRSAIVAIDLARAVAGDGRPGPALRLLDAVLAATPADGDADDRFVAATAHEKRAEIEVGRGDVRAALAALERALAIDPDHYDATSRMAFLLATTADPTLRDPPRAVALAERAFAQQREFASASTLAAALAAAGERARALAVAREGLELATSAQDPRGVAALQRQVALYAPADDPLSAAP